MTTVNAAALYTPSSDDYEIISDASGFPVGEARKIVKKQEPEKSPEVDNE